MKESDVVEHFTRWLEHCGWSIRPAVDFADVVAERDGITMIAEAKGTTTSPGLNVDTAYGQLLRKIGPDQAKHCYALVVPLSARRPAERVRAQVRALLNIAVYLVADDGTVDAT